MTEKVRIGIIGGTFDPIHFGHLMIAENAALQYNLEQVIFIPTGLSPHKNDDRIVDANQRVNMLILAIRDNPRFQISTMEIVSKETSYTYRTLEILHENHPDWELYFILGADSLDYLDQWYKPEIIFARAHVLAAVRDDMNREQMQEKAEELHGQFDAHISFISTPNVSISSHNIRDRIHDAQSIKYLVPEEVRQYIEEHQLYSNKGHNNEQ